MQCGCGDVENVETPVYSCDFYVITIQGIMIATDIIYLFCTIDHRNSHNPANTCYHMSYSHKGGKGKGGLLLNCWYCSKYLKHG